MTGERTSSDTTSWVEAAGGPDTPFPIVSNTAKTGWTESVYLQDEWKVFRP